MILALGSRERSRGGGREYTQSNQHESGYDGIGEWLPENTELCPCRYGCQERSPWLLEVGPVEWRCELKGVVLAGGTGSRLFPLTKVTNKHLLPVYNKPMVYYPIQTLVNAGITEILLVTGGNNAGEFLRLLGNGREFGLKHMNYTYQEHEGGIAEALGLAEHFAAQGPICVVLGDNLIEYNICQAAENFKKQARGAKVILKKVPDAQRFGVAEMRGNRVVNIDEKPKAPKSDYAVTGIYFYDSSVFEKIRRLKPSGRGELEITDVNNFYIEEGTLTYEVLEGWWTDAGTFESLLRANNFVAQTGANKLAVSGAAESGRAAEETIE
jgi:glucose-1-phosphate thymidylyltransferase